jgi:hypothetical protein
MTKKIWVRGAKDTQHKRLCSCSWDRGRGESSAATLSDTAGGGEIDRKINILN